MSWSARLFSIRGIDVRVHATFALIVAFGAVQWGTLHGSSGALFGAAFTLALFGCVLLHELGHSVVAQRFGIRVKDIVLLPIGGVANLQGRPGSPKQEIAIALAGPAVNFVLAAVFALAFAAVATPAASVTELIARARVPSTETLLLLLTSGNLTLALFNLLPVFPLDGGRVFRALLEMRLGPARATAWAAGVGQVASVAMLGYAVFTGQIVMALIGLLIFFAAGQERAHAALSGPLARLRAEDAAELPAVEFSATSRVSEAIPMLLRSQQRAFPVVYGSDVVGVVLRSELVRAASGPVNPALPVRAIARRPVFVEGAMPLAAALDRLREHGEPVAVVTGPDYPLGLLSEGEALAKLAQLPDARWVGGARRGPQQPEQVLSEDLRSVRRGQSQ